MNKTLGTLLLCSICWQTAFGFQQSKPQVYNVSEQDALKLVNDLITSIQPDNAENAYMPEFLKEKIRWVYAEVAAKRLALKYASDEGSKLGQVLMHSFYVGNMPTIEINANHLVMLIRVQQHTATGFTRMQKNTFAISLAHEAVHLEKSPEFFKRGGTREQFIAEEFRTINKVDQLVVDPLLAKGEPIDIDFSDLNKILKRCGRKMPCQPFVDYYINGKRPGPQVSGAPVGPSK